MPQGDAGCEALLSAGVVVGLGNVCSTTWSSRGACVESLLPQTCAPDTVGGMGHPFTPLETDARQKNLTYVSVAKLEQLLLDPVKRGFTLTLPGSVGGAGVASHQRGVRDLLNSAARLFEDSGVLTHETSPAIGEWLLVRVIATCGTAWPWNGDRAEFHETAWWVGQSAELRILAYGHRSHLLGVGKMPPPVQSEGRATWWPSLVGGYQELLSSVARVVRSDRLDAKAELGSRLNTKATFRDLDRYFFNEGVHRENLLVQRGVYEMLLRVDGVEDSDDGEPPVVYGSPLWVARETRAVPGTYFVADYPEERDIVAVASWDGGSWSDLRMRDDRDPSLRHPQGRVRLPEMPTEPPHLEQLATLAVRTAPRE